eukprot:scaffold256018_cov31-Tisochrysis_lutea.AAC.2
MQNVTSTGSRSSERARSALSLAWCSTCEACVAASLLGPGGHDAANCNLSGLALSFSCSGFESMLMFSSLADYPTIGQVCVSFLCIRFYHRAFMRFDKIRSFLLLRSSIKSYNILAAHPALDPLLSTQALYAPTPSALPPPLGIGGYM